MEKKKNSKFRIIIISILIFILVIAVIGIVAVKYSVYSTVAVDDYKSYYANDTSAPKNGSVKVTFLGTTMLQLDDGQTQLLFDPFVSRSSMFHTFLYKISTDTTLVNGLLSKYKMNNVKAIFASHSHYDHTLDLPFIATKTKTIVYGSVSTLNIGRGGGLKDEQLVLLEPGKELQFGRFTVIVIDSKHSPATAANDDLGQVITQPLVQPNKVSKYVEGGSFDFLVKYNNKIIYIKPSANYIDGKLKGLNADVLFMGVGMLGKQDSTFLSTYYNETVGTLKPILVIPIHWDNFFTPYSNKLEMLAETEKVFDFLISKAQVDNLDFKILQGGNSILLFKSEQ